MDSENVGRLDPRLDEADALFRSGDEAGAIGLAEMVVGESIDNLIEGLLAVVEMSAGRRDWSRALGALELLDAMPVDDPEFQAMVANNLAWVLGHLGRSEESLAAARASLERAPAGTRDPRMLMNLAFAFSRAGDRGEALKLILVAAELDPGDPDIAYDKACHLAASGQLQEGLNALELALGLAPAKSEVALYDDDFEAVRDAHEYAPRFTELIDRYRTW